MKSDSVFPGENVPEVSGSAMYQRQRPALRTEHGQMVNFR